MHGTTLFRFQCESGFEVDFEVGYPEELAEFEELIDLIESDGEVARFIGEIGVL